MRGYPFSLEAFSKHSGHEERSKQPRTLLESSRSPLCHECFEGSFKAHIWPFGNFLETVSPLIKLPTP